MSGTVYRLGPHQYIAETHSDVDFFAQSKYVMNVEAQGADCEA